MVRGIRDAEQESRLQAGRMSRCEWFEEKAAPAVNVPERRPPTPPLTVSCQQHVPGCLFSLRESLPSSGRLAHPTGLLRPRSPSFPLTVTNSIIPATYSSIHALFRPHICCGVRLSAQTRHRPGNRDAHRFVDPRARPATSSATTGADNVVLLPCPAPARARRIAAVDDGLTR